MVTENKETTQTQEAPKPKVEDSPEFREAVQKAVRQSTSKYQQQASEARRETKKLAGQIQTLQEQMEQAKNEAEIARLAGDDVDAAARLKEQIKFRDELDKKQKQLTEREERVLELERRTSIRLLHEEYGIPTSDLEEYETLDEMEKAALKYQLAELKKGNGQKPKPEERETKPIDASDGRLGSVKLAKPGTPEFEEQWERAKAAGRQ